LAKALASIDTFAARESYALMTARASRSERCKGWSLGQPVAPISATWACTSSGTRLLASGRARRATTRHPRILWTSADLDGPAVHALQSGGTRRGHSPAV